MRLEKHWYRDKPSLQITMKKESRILTQSKYIFTIEGDAQHRTEDEEDHRVKTDKSSEAFSSWRQVKVRLFSRNSEINPLFHEGAPNSTVEADEMCDALDIPLKLEPPRSLYEHVWGTNCADGRTIIESWTITVQYANLLPKVLKIDLVDG